MTRTRNVVRDPQSAAVETLAPMVVTPTASKPRYVMLDGLRGWAALVVALGHFFPHYGIFETRLFRSLLDTSLAVGVFFVLSGFVLAITFVDRPMKYPQFASNMISRHARLAIPILAVTLGVYLLQRFDLLRNDETASLVGWGYDVFYRFDGGFLDSIRWALFDVFFRYDNAHTYIPPAWTMRTELRGSYYVYILLFLSTITRFPLRNRWVFPLLCAAALIGPYLHFHYVAFFVAGILLAVYHRHIRTNGHSGILALVVFASALVISAFRTPARAEFILYATSVAISWAVVESTMLSRFFESRVSRFLGKLSFTLYLVHVPIYCSLSAALLLALQGTGIGWTTMWLVAGLVSITTVFLVAYAFYPAEWLAIRASRRIKSFVQSACTPRPSH